MSFFGDILDDADNRMDYDMDEPFKCDDPKLATLKVKSNPAKGVVSTLFLNLLFSRVLPRVLISCQMARDMP